MVASYNGCCEVIEWLVASGRDLGELGQAGKWSSEKYSALQIAKHYQRNEVVSLLERFMAQPEQTRYGLRVKLGALDELAAELFALIVFLCDNHLRLKPVVISSNQAVVRFFVMVQRMPMELQMVLCHRAVGSMKENILHRDSEAAFKALAKVNLIAALAPDSSPPSLTPIWTFRAATRRRKRCIIS